MTSTLLIAALVMQGSAQVVYRFQGAMPTGVAVSKTGRIFVTFPRWDKPQNVPITLGEIKQGKVVAFPNPIFNRMSKKDAAERLMNVQSAYVDDKDRLWAVDTGSINFGFTHPEGPKLVCFDLTTNKVARVIHFPTSVVFPTSYLNDVRFDLARGAGGYAFLTDSSDKGPNGIVVVDLATGESWRRLNDHPSTKADPNVRVVSEGQPLMLRPPKGPVLPMLTGADGIEIDPKQERLYYCPLVGHTLYSVDVAALVDRSQTDDAVAATVKVVTEKPASDGLGIDPDGRVLLTDFEHSQVQRIRKDGRLEPFLQLAPKYWPDTLAVSGTDLYVIANQLGRRPGFHRGKDLRVPPYLLVKVAIPR